MEGTFSSSYEYKPVPGEQELAESRDPSEKGPMTTGPAEVHDLKNVSAKKPGIRTPKDFEKNGRMAA
jgi:hypothetical protein